MSVKPPRYEEIASYVRSLVAAGSPGDRLPSDAELCERFSVSRMTARYAVAQLAQDGLLVRRRGQGTFVASRPVMRVLGSPLSFTESMRRRGLRASSRLLRWTEIDRSPENAAALQLLDGQSVWLLERLRLADGVPMAIESAVLPSTVAAVMDGGLTDGSLHAAFEQLHRIPTRAQAWVSARIATAGERKLLDLIHPAVLLVEQRIITDQDDIPLEHTETRYAAERYRFETVLRRDSFETLR
ncbi:transcriptional regulator NagR [soil metagenome]